MLYFQLLIAQGLPVFNWQINVADLVAVIGAGMLLYGRLVKLETKIDPIWRWWNATRSPTTTQDGDGLVVDRRKH